MYNGLRSILIIYEQPKDLLKASYLVPKWMIVIYILALMLITVVLLSAILIVSLAPRPANYQENCKGRSCAKDGNMKCLDNVCTCTSNQYYVNKCVEKKSNWQRCTKSYQCRDYLSCIGGLCQCNQTHYHEDNGCLKRKSYMETCKGDQCFANSMLYCNITIGECVCASKRYA